MRETTTVIDEGRARQLAEQRLEEMASSTFVVTGVEEYDVGWVFFYDSRRHQQTRAFEDALAGNAPILVDRSDGSVHVTGTALPVDQYIERYRHRDPSDERSWHP
jgi:hypothetical protein